MTQILAVDDVILLVDPIRLRVNNHFAAAEFDWIYCVTYLMT